MKKMLIVVGTRPEAIKIVPLILEMKASSDIQCIVCSTAQHRQMLDQVFSLFEIVPDFDLDIMSENQSLGDMTARILMAFGEVLEKVGPDVVIIQGDTTTAFAAGLAAFYEKVPIGHIEAGLRTYNRHNPFPEEINRHLLSVLADYHFAPTEKARDNLINENIGPERIWVTGNTIIDALMLMKKKLETPETCHRISRDLYDNYGLDLDGLDNKKLILVTGHRRESFGEGFRNICEALRDIARQRNDVLIVYPVHLNPNVREMVYEYLSDIKTIILMSPLGYASLVYLMNKCHFILTDSGGIQEEAPSLGKPVLVMRNTTERPEGVNEGVSKLVGTDRDQIVSDTIELLDDEALYQKMSTGINPYGDGQASRRILETLINVLHKKSS